MKTPDSFLFFFFQDKNMVSPFCSRVVKTCYKHPFTTNPGHHKNSFVLLSDKFFPLCPGYKDSQQSLRGMADMRAQGETGRLTSCSLVPSMLPVSLYRAETLLKALGSVPSYP